MFYQHYFRVPPTDTEIVKYSFTTAVVEDPLSGKKDYFIGMGSASKFDGNGLRKCGGRPPVQLVFLLDVSGSMNSRFYTRSSKQMRKKGGEESSDEATRNMTKLDAAKEALLGLLENMQEGDSFGLVSFDTRAYVSDASPYILHLRQFCFVVCFATSTSNISICLGRFLFFYFFLVFILSFWVLLFLSGYYYTIISFWV